jgi:hypothetical protein
MGGKEGFKIDEGKNLWTLVFECYFSKKKFKYFLTVIFQIFFNRYFSNIF